MKPQSKTITLKEICKEHKLCPRMSRMLLREAVKDAKKYPNICKDHKPRTAWMWSQGSKALEEAMTILIPPTPKKAI